MVRFPAIILILFLSCCKEGHRLDCIKRSGEVVKERRETDAFSTVLVYDHVDVILIADTADFVEVETGKHLVAGIENRVENGVLIISNQNKCNFSRSYSVPENVYVHYRKLYEVISDATGNITTGDTLVADSLDFHIRNTGDIIATVNSPFIETHIHGVGNVNLKGISDYHAIHSIGNSIVTAKELFTVTTWIFCDITGFIEVYAQKNLEVVSEGVGDVIYFGEPANIKATLSGKGRLIQGD